MTLPSHLKKSTLKMTKDEDRWRRGENVVYVDVSERIKNNLQTALCEDFRLLKLNFLSPSLPQENQFCEMRSNG